MVSFSCEVCNDTLVKKKLMGHFGRCPYAVFTCIDCNTTFQNNDFQKHTQCISEDQKYQGKLYKGTQNQTPKQAPKQAPKPEAVKTEPAKPVESVKDLKDSKTSKDTKQSKKQKDETISANEGALKFKKTMPLKKALKTLKKSHKLDKDGLLDKIVVTADGRLEWA